MDLSTKLEIYQQLKTIYNDFAGTLSVACENRCAACCTRNVIVTGLEGLEIMDHLESANQLELLDRIRRDVDKKRFQPEITTNGLAELCMQGEEPPEEHSEVSWGQCPLLIDDLCSIYEVRPFECRCFISENDCRQVGSADMDPYVITANNVFRQFLEHVDQKGICGNVSDVLLLLADSDQREMARTGQLKPDAPLITNLPLKMLLIPPEFQEKMQPIITAIQGIRVGLSNP